METEKAREAERIAQRLGREEGLDLEAMEFFVRSQMHEAGTRALESFLAERLRQEEPPECGENHPPRRMVLYDRREKTIRTILGEVRVARGRYVCPVCGAVRYAADEKLGVEDTGFSPGARRMMARAGAQESFAEAAADLGLFADLRVGAKDVERVAEATGRRVDDWMQRQGALARLMPPTQEQPKILYIEFDGTGAPMRPEELAESRGKGADGKAHTREVKVGCVFTQTRLDKDGNPVRDDASTTYVAAIEPSVDFGHRIHAEAMRRGLANAATVVVLSDGAQYNKTIVAEHFPQALHALDLRHAQEHLSDFTRDVCHEPLDGALHKKTRDLMHRGRIQALLKRMQAALPRNGPRRALGEQAIRYFRENAHAMRYDRFRAMGLFVGSGVIEAACRTLVGQRLKRSGMFWTVRGANAIIALRCCFASGRFEQFWEDAA